MRHGFNLFKQEFSIFSEDVINTLESMSEKKHVEDKPKEENQKSEMPNLLSGLKRLSKSFKHNKEN
jgi:hypothetical protein